MSSKSVETPWWPTMSMDRRLILAARNKEGGPSKRRGGGGQGDRGAKQWRGRNTRAEGGGAQLLLSGYMLRGES